MICMEKKKLLNIVLIIAIGLLIAGPIIGFATEKVNIDTRTNHEIEELSDDEIQSAYSTNPFRLSLNQKIAIKLSVYTPNTTVHLKILDAFTFAEEYAANSDPTGLSGLNFIYSTFAWGQSPSTSTTGATSVTINDQGVYYIEFAGARSGINLISIPGSYVVIVYGTNTSPETTVVFNITIKKDGPGGFLGTLFVTIGIIVLVCYALLLAYNYLNNLRRER